MPRRGNLQSRDWNLLELRVPEILAGRIPEILAGREIRDRGWKPATRRYCAGLLS
jgi:hypothetical protein